jgi:triosephosphate isomerase
VFLSELQEIIRNTPIYLGAQDCHEKETGAFTGDISAHMLRDVGAEYVIVGHSERRRGHCEEDSAVARKANAAHFAEVQPIICVGETKAQRESGEHKEAITLQVKRLLADIVPHHAVIIAYEPIWAIGTGHTPTLEEIAEMCEVIMRECRAHAMLNVQLLYGGSVRGENAASLFTIPLLSGVLVGNASMQIGQWTEIVKAAMK